MADEMKSMLKMSWEGGKEFLGVTATSQQIRLNGETGLGVSPMEALLAAFCGCMGIDVVNILQKMRVDLQALRVEASAVRNNVPPQHFKKIHLTFFVKGDVPRAKIDRAIDLSFQTYCSVFHSLRKDLQVEKTVVRE